MILDDLGPVADWPELRQALHNGTGPALLRLTPRLMVILEDSSTREDLKDILSATGRTVRAVALDAGELPGWDRPYRAALAVGAAELLADLNPQRSRLWVVVRIRKGAGLAYLLRVAAFCHDLAVQTRRIVSICPAEAPSGLSEKLADPASVEILAGLTGLSTDEAAAALARHVVPVHQTPNGLQVSGDEEVVLPF